MKNLIDGGRVELQLFTTFKCNLSCKYCAEDIGDIRNSQSNIEYTLDQLELFVETHFLDKEIIVTFYGGEPLLNIEYIKDVMYRFPLWRYQLQTNGTLLTNLNYDILQRFDSILISIDGDESITDLYRGQGVHSRVIKNLQYARENTDAYLTGRCTWSSPSPKAKDITHILDLFDYVYFQFVHVEWIYTDEYIIEMKKALKELVEIFLSSKQLMKIVPLMGFCRNILFPSRAKELYNGKTQCRVSSHLFNILPNGKIAACSDCAHDKKLFYGSVIENYCDTNPLQYSDKFPCKSCIAFNVCRMNCVKGLYRSYIENNLEYKQTILDSTCIFIKYLYELFMEEDLTQWYMNLSRQDKRELLNSPLYEYVEIMP